jgi:hypothetical protein
VCSEQAGVDDAALAVLPAALTSVDLRLTNVTPGAVARLASSRPSTTFFHDEE